MQLAKSISIITLSTIFSLTVISTYANDLNKNNKEQITTNDFTKEEKKNSSTLTGCHEFPLCDINKAQEDNEWPQVSIISQK